MSFDNLMGYNLSVPMYMQNFITIFHSLHEIGTFSLFENLELGKTSTVKNDISQSLWLDIVNINVYAEEKIFHSVQEIRPFSLFQNLALSKASTNDKCHFAIVSLFSEFKPRQKLNQSQMSLDSLMGYILSMSMCMHHSLSLSSRYSAIIIFSELELSKASTDEKCHFAVSWARSC